MNPMKSLTAKLPYSQWAPLLLRAVMGYGFMLHGWAKLSRGPANFEKLLVQLGVPLHHAASWVVPFVELLGGFAILIGAFATLAAIPLIAVMLTAMFTVHLKYGFSSIKTIGLGLDGPLFGPPGYEVALLYIAGLIAIILGGAGMLSVDSLLRKKVAAS
jgi:putative oxidoreductase